MMDPNKGPKSPQQGRGRNRGRNRGQPKPVPSSQLGFHFPQLSKPGSYSSQAGTPSGTVVAQVGNKQLLHQSVSEMRIDPTHPAFAQVQALLASSSQEVTSASYADAIAPPTIEKSHGDGYEQLNKERTIVVLEPHDQKWIDENNPFPLMQKYLATNMYPYPVGKSRPYYESILIVTGSAKIDHVKPGGVQASSHYVYSKIHILQMILPGEWGVSPLKERDYVHPQTKAVYKFNYYDYIHAFYRVFYYENPKYQHSWFIRISPTILARKEYPQWIFNWWKLFGPPLTILPDLFREFFTEWLQIAPIMTSAYAQQYYEGSAFLFFLMEFEIPWIWRWQPFIDVSIPGIRTLKRRFAAKFWLKMLDINPQTGVRVGATTIDNITSTLLRYKEAPALQQKATPRMTPFQLFEQDLKRTNPYISEDTILELWIEESNRESQILMDKIRKKRQLTTASDSTMASDDQNQFTVLAREGQGDEAPHNMPLYWDPIKKEVGSVAPKPRSKASSSSDEVSLGTRIRNAAKGKDKT